MKKYYEKPIIDVEEFATLTVVNCMSDGIEEDTGSI